MRAVVDTNLLLRTAAGERRSPLFAAWRDKRFALVVSAETLGELEDVMARPRVRRFLPPLRGQEAIRLGQVGVFVGFGLPVGSLKTRLTLLIDLE